MIVMWYPNGDFHITIGYTNAEKPYTKSVKKITPKLRTPKSSAENLKTRAKKFGTKQRNGVKIT